MLLKQHLVLTLVMCAASTAAKKSNIVFILTDDQDVMLSGMTPLTETQKLLGEQGATFSNAFSTTPVCCPSRSSILTGLYIHSHGTINNTVGGGCSSSTWQAQFETRSYGKLLHEAGYRTFFAGKYLNEYGYRRCGGPEHVPPGWDWWVGLVGNSVYYNYTLSINGTAVKRGDEEDDYLTDVLKKYSLEFLEQQKDEFLLVVSTPSAHAPFTPANRHKGRFSDVQAPRTPNFNLPVNKTKHWLLRLPPEVLPQETIDQVDEIYRNRWETLLAVDELVAAVVGKLEELKVLDNTYVVFSSDHGYHMGQFAQPWDKRQPYEYDIRIPLLVRGPQVPPNATVADPVLNIDFAATFLDVAGVQHDTDGTSFLPKLNQVPEGSFSRQFLIEYHGEGQYRPSSDCWGEDPRLSLCFKEASCKCQDSVNNTYTCVRRLSDEVDQIYCAFEDEELFVELYDMDKDPFQLSNVAAVADRSVIADYGRVLDCCRNRITGGKSVEECLVKS